MGKVFNKGLKEEDKKEGLFKRLKNIEGEYEELLNTLSEAHKVSKAPKNESIYNYNSQYVFYKFYRDFENFEKISLTTKDNKMTDSHEFLNSFIDKYKETNTETSDRKKRILSYVKSLYNKYLVA